MRDVAALAGTSTAVVSYVVNDGPRRVAEETRLRVLGAIEKLDYRRNDLAAALVVGATDTYGLVVPDISNPFFASLAHALGAEVYAAGKILLLGDSGEDAQRERTIVEGFLQRQVDGLIYIGTDDRWHSERIAHACGTVVMLDRVSPDSRASSVTVDNVAGSRMAVQHLIDHGYRDIGMIAGPEHLLTSQDRVTGWRDTLFDNGLVPDTRWTASGQFTRETGARAISHWLTVGPLPRAVFASNDQQAAGAMQVLIEHGLRTPEDLAIVSFDGVDNLSHMTIPLTTVRQPVEAIAQKAVQLLLSERRGRPVHEVVDVELVIGRSCGCGAQPTQTLESPAKGNSRPDRGMPC
jgi:LacI family transcriptional regulator